MDKRVLILEDDPVSVRLYKTLLSDCQVVHASSVAEAVNLHERNPNYDLYIIDMHLGKKLTGADFINLLEGSGAKIIIVTSLDLNFVKEYKFKPYEYFQKPININEFREKAKQLLSQS